MKTKTLLIALTFLTLICSHTLARATTISVHSCFNFDKDFSDAEFGDYSTINGTHTNAAGLYVKLQQEISDGVWFTSWEGYTDQNTGCVYNILTVGATYRYRMLAKARIGDNDYSSVTNDIIVHDNFDYTTYWGQNTSSWIQGGTNYKEFTWTYNSTYKVSNVLAAATRSLRNFNVGADNELLRYVTLQCPGEEPGDGVSCYNHDDSRVALSPDGRGRKFTITHETGHFMHWTLNDVYGGEYIITGCGDWDETTQEPACSDGGSLHAWRSKEHQGCAAKEGHANYYAAAVYNDWEETDCNYGDEDCGTNEQYMEENCPVRAFKRGVESDWTQFYWDLTSIRGWGVRYVTQLFVEPDNYWADWDVWETLAESVAILHPPHSLLFSASGNSAGVNH